MDDGTGHSELEGRLARVERERDFYRKLLDLGHTGDIEGFLGQALRLIAEMAGARRGYIEIRGGGGHDEGRSFWMAHGWHDGEVDEIRSELSRGVIAEALATGKTIALASALADPRFGSRKSVRRNRIEAVLCAPIGADPPVGVVYLQDRGLPGPFSDEDRARIETFARHVMPFADRLLLRERSAEEADPTRALRTQLRVDDIIGTSAPMAYLLQQVALVAPLDVGVLLTGASGTGKTQVARAIHDNGARAAAPFIEVNCAALPETLVESELFGAVAGGHSTATKRVEGRVSAAAGGTLFLDEIAELRPSVQAKLLQLLQSKEYYPLGSGRPVKADVRLISATNVDLKAAVARKAFREDLYYRLQVLPIRLPSLAERKGDIRGLVQHFCDRALSAHRLPRLTLSARAFRAAEAAEWAGNVRELAHAVEAAVIRAAGEGVSEVETRHLFPTPAGPGGSAGTAVTYQEATRRFQEQFLRKALEETDWNITETAEKLELARSHVYNLIRAFGLERGR